MFEKIVDFFANKKAQNELKTNPLWAATKLASDEALKETGLDKIRDKMKPHIDVISKEITEIIYAEDKISALRKKYAETILSYAKYQVLVLDENEDSTGGLKLVGLPGITGGLRKHLVKIAETDSLIREELHGQTSVPEKLTLSFMKEHIRLRYLLFYWRHDIFNVLRVGLEDHNPNKGKDWFKPFFYSMCVYHEYTFRDQLKLKQGVDVIQNLQHSTFLDIVIEGVKYPDLAFYDRYKDAIDNKRLYFKKSW